MLRIVGAFFASCRVFDFHVVELFRVENLATLQALDKLGVVVPGDDPDLGMLAGCRHRSLAVAQEQPRTENPSPKGQWCCMPCC